MMRAKDLQGLGPVGTNGPVPTIEQDLDTMRDVYMLPSQQAAFDRIAAIVRAWEGAATGTVVQVGDDDDGVPRALIESTRDELRRGPPLCFRRVRIVAEPRNPEAGR